MNGKALTKTKEQIWAADPKRSVWVTANAGSGKTYILVERVISLLLAGAEPASILCITFTKAAASEMSARLFTKMSIWAVMDDAKLAQQLNDLGVSVDTANLAKARRLFARALETPGGLKIQTIHAFCEKLLQQFPVEAGVHPGFNVMDDRQSNTLLTDAISHVLRQAEAEPETELGSALANCVKYVGNDGFQSLMRQFLSDAKNLRTVLNSALTAAEYEIIMKNSFGLALLTSTSSISNHICEIDRRSYLHHAQKLSAYKIFGTHDTSAIMNAIGQSDFPFELLKSLYFTGEFAVRKNLMAVKTAKEIPATLDFLEREQKRCVPLFEHHDLLVRIEATSSLFILAQAIHKRISRQKHAKGTYDFDDLINRTQNLLSSLNTTQWVLYKLDAGLKHILVDEAQDTSPVQWKIISALCEEFFAGEGMPQNAERTLFVVGDRKQSIFSFQGADVRALADARISLSQRIKGARKNLDDVDLAISYRSVGEILASVDKTFPPNNPARLGFATDDAAENPHQSNRLGALGVFELWPLVTVENDDDPGNPWEAPVDREEAQSPRRRLAGDIAAKIKSWLGRRKLESRERLVRADDILILLQSRGPMFSMIIAALRKEGVPVAGADRLRLLESLAVQDLLILIQWLLLPQDDYALACLLKCPFVPQPLDEDALMALAGSRGECSLWQQLCREPSLNLEWLNELKVKMAHLGPYEFLAFVLTKFRKSMVQRLGSEAWDATDALLDQALEYEIENGRSLAGFLHWFQADETTIKREMDKANGEVRLMTVHGAKGLEANIVILADAATVPRGGLSEPSLVAVPDDLRSAGLPLWALPHLTVAPELQRWKDNSKLKIKAEHNRLLYVAMTRACDELYVCGVKTTKNIPHDSWYALIESSVGSPAVGSTLPQLDYETTSFLPEIQDQTLPSWVTEVPQKEIEPQPLALTTLSSGLEPVEYKTAKSNAKRGIAIHAFLQAAADLEPAQRQDLVAKSLDNFGLEEREALNLLKLMGSPELSGFFGPDSLAEVELRGVLPDGREIAGRVDRIVITATNVLVLDYKTDHFVAETLSENHPYSRQMALYSKLLTGAYPAHLVKAALLWTQTGKLEWLSDVLLGQSLRNVEGTTLTNAPSTPTSKSEI